MTPPVRAQIVNAVTAGVSIGRAAELAGVSGECVRLWRRQGEADERAGRTGTPQAAFVRALAEARAKIVGLVEGSVVNAAVRGRDWRAGAWWLERQYPDEYGRKDTVTVEIQQQMATDLLDFLQARLDADTYQRVVAALTPDSGAEQDEPARLH